jgi:GNAT superfamily N-acetyltransferase
MDIRECILKEELEYPKLFSSYLEEDFGIIFYFEDDKELHDGNHAVLYPEKIVDLGNVLDKITKFYLEKEIAPAIYHPFVPGYFEKNKEIFESHGYKITINDNYRFMILVEENTIKIPKRLEIKRMVSWDERISNDIIIPCGEEWEIEATKISLRNNDNYMFVGYLNNIAVTYTTFHKSINGCTRFDYILTAKNHRGKGYARELLSYVVDFCRYNKFLLCFQWAGPSEKITYDAGFRVSFEAESGRANYIGL